MISSTKTFYLKKHEWEFISKYCINLQLNNKLLRENSSFILALDTLEQEKLNDHLIDLFVSIGLKDDCEPNSIGLQIEGLIDIFNPYKT